MWTKNQGLDTAKEAALDIKNFGRFIIEAASKGNEAKGNEAAINVTKPWKLFFDLLRQLKTKMCSEDRTPDEAAGSMGTTPDAQEKQTGDTAPLLKGAERAPCGCIVPCCAVLNGCPAAVLCPAVPGSAVLPAATAAAGGGAAAALGHLPESTHAVTQSAHTRAILHCHRSIRIASAWG